MSFAAGHVLGAYEIIGLVGAGGMGEVYRARDTRLGRHVAIKVVASARGSDPEATSRFEREARIISSLDHPNICPLYDVGHDPQSQADYLVMPLLDGESLAQRLARGALPWPDALAIATQIASALEAAHARGIVHRDLKPGNVMLTSSGARLLDFGLAALRLPDEAPANTGVTQSTHTALTRAGLVFGTLPYMAPEQLEGRPVDQRADIFAFGAVLYEMLAGRRAFAADSDAAVIAAVMHVEPPALAAPTLPPAFAAIVRRCLAKTPKDRYQRAGEVSAALALVATSSSTVAVAPGTPAARRRAWLILIGAALVAALVAGGIYVKQAGRTAADRSAPPRSRAITLVVLPFQSASSDPAERAFWLGLSDAITAKFAELPAARDLHVERAMDSSGRRLASVQEARREVGATQVVEGRLTNGEMELALVDALTNRPLRSVRVAADSHAAAHAQDVIAGAIATLLNLQLTPGERSRLDASPSAARAYDIYLQALGYLRDLDKPEHHDTAIGMFQHALELNQESAAVYAGLGEAYWRKYGDTRQERFVDEARRSCERALAIDESDAAPHLCLGLVENGTGRYQKAAEEYGHALDRSPDMLDAFIGLATAYERLGDYTRAEATLKRALAVRPGSWRGHGSIGEFYFRRRDYPSAEQAFEQVVALNPDSWRGYSNLGAVQLAQHKAAQAVASFERSLALKPNYQAAANLGNVYFYEQRDYRKAADAYKRASEINAREYVVWQNYAAALEWAGDAGGARTAYRRAADLAQARLSVNPNDTRVMMALAEARAALGEARVARELLQKALAAAPSDSGVLMDAAVLHEYRFHERDAALDLLTRGFSAGLQVADVERSPSLARLRADSRYRELKDRLSRDRGPGRS